MLLFGVLFPKAVFLSHWLVCLNMHINTCVQWYQRQIHHHTMSVHFSHFGVKHFSVKFLPLILKPFIRLFSAVVCVWMWVFGFVKHFIVLCMQDVNAKQSKLSMCQTLTTRWTSEWKMMEHRECFCECVYCSLACLIRWKYREPAYHVRWIWTN